MSMQVLCIFVFLLVGYSFAFSFRRDFKADEREGLLDRIFRKYNGDVKRYFDDDDVLERRDRDRHVLDSKGFWGAYEPQEKRSNNEPSEKELLKEVRKRLINEVQRTLSDISAYERVMNERKGTEEDEGARKYAADEEEEEGEDKASRKEKPKSNALSEREIQERVKEEIKKELAEMDKKSADDEEESEEEAFHQKSREPKLQDEDEDDLEKRLLKMFM
ncbi:trichohyalin-like [Limulus polyphemus]|uniref:Trichohyalin-like n=1 Tax=Limulus polyphemus TaxID=6850 RepID=A0ABM1TMX9_LIMPO|nr:trichohyalin-like [Limulus polyphemus]XP_022257235.1 trichohyalin-like [Limulus polyphemus]